MTARNDYTESFKQEMFRRLAAGESAKTLSEETGANKRTLEGWKRLAIKQVSVHDSNETGELHRPIKEKSDLKEKYELLKEKYQLLIEENESLKVENELVKEEREALRKTVRIFANS
ncbi:hypothetical protein [Paenibacillus sp. Y412MC10]|uniref:hypothetical protein n=1 Tax=Geobacillus sp. (strain Y412MC10) TaxID=481743 RepID=UPI00119D57C9|nr:hypothetical protein [Paenibacillus sp. Y412MC10]